MVHLFVLNLVSSSFILLSSSSVIKKAQMLQVNKHGNFLKQRSATKRVGIHCSGWLPPKQQGIKKHEIAEGERTDGPELT